MSLSSTPSQEPAKKLTPIEVSPIRPVPALDPPPEKQPEETEEKPETSPHRAEASTQEESTPAAEAASEPKAADPQPDAARGKWQGILLDTLLTLLVVAVLACGGYYIKTQWDKYRVPTIMELTNTECLELCAQREALQDSAHHADEQLRMRKRLAHLENQLRQFSEQKAQLGGSISEQQNRVLALQHEIRQADKEARSVARGLLPGLPVGDVSTRRGKTYHNATITRLQGRRLSLRTPEGAASFPVAELVKDNLPDIVLYALGVIDLVDTSDFTANGAAPTGPTPKNAKLQANRPKKTQDYEPEPGGPVVDTEANKTTTNTADDMPSAPQQPSGDVWDAPLGDLPL